MSDRLADLEARVQALEAEVARLNQAAASAPPPLGPSSASSRAPRRPAAPPPRVWPALSTDDLLGKLGIGLLLVGVAFLLKWSIDQGWLGPAVRVAGAALLGAVLVGVGVWLRPRRTALGDVLAGGGLATLYGSVFAASLLYGFIGPGAALGLAALVAAASYGLSLRLGAPLLAVVGVIGALGFPVVIYENPTSLRLALAFAAVVAGGGMAVWWKTGWQGLLVALALAFWTALAVLRYKAGHLVGTERHAFQAAVVVGWALVGIVPLLRGVPDVVSGALPRLLHPRPLAVWTSGLAAFALTALLWHLSDSAQALLALAFAAGYGAVALSRTDEAAEGAALVALGLASWAGVAVLRGGLLPGALAALAVAGAYAARRRDWRGMTGVAEVAVVLAALWALVFFAAEAGERPGAGDALGAVLSAGAMGYGAYLRRGTKWQGAAVVLAHAVVLAALRYLLAWLPLGTALVNGAWGLYAVALLAAGLRLGRAELRLLGLGTLAMTVGKILLFDIRGIPMAARVVIFLGLGGLLLAVSYFAPHWIKGNDERRASNGERPRERPMPTEPPGDDPG